MIYQGLMQVITRLASTAAAKPNHNSPKIPGDKMIFCSRPNRFCYKSPEDLLDVPDDALASMSPDQVLFVCRLLDCLVRNHGVIAVFCWMKPVRSYYEYGES
jgi:hypothetical protein